MLSLLGFSAWISCEDKPLSEFEVTTSGNKVTCWIPSKEGKAFVVNWRDDGSGIDTAAYITLDGFVVAGRFLFGQGQASRSGVRTGISTERPFIFSKVDEGKDEPQIQIKSEGKTGMILLRIKRIRRGGGRKPSDLRPVPEQVPGRRKSGEDCVGFGTERPAEFQQPSTWAVEPYDKNSPGSFVTFVFRYRSPEFLISQGIMSPEAELVSSPDTSAVSTPLSSSSNASPGSRKRDHRTVSAASHSSDRSESSTPFDYANHVDRYPGEGLFWFQDNKATDITEHIDKKSRTK